MGNWGDRSRTRNDGHDRQPKRSLQGDQFSDVVAFDAMSEVLKEVSQHEQAHAPVPIGDEEKRHPDERHRDAEQMNREVERVLMAFAPVGDDPQETAGDGEGVTLGRCVAHAEQLKRSNPWGKLPDCPEFTGKLEACPTEDYARRATTLRPRNRIP